MKLKSFLQDTPIWLYTFVLAIVVGAAVYQTLVILPEFTREMPNSMIALANSEIKPAYFWGSPIFGISSLLLPILALISNWKSQRRRWLLLSLAFGIAASIFTSIYFIPRLKIMGLFDVPPTTDLPLLIETIKEWVFMDKFRFWLLVVPAFFFALKATAVSNEKRVVTPVRKKALPEESYAV
ncbi:MAG TPA: DUF4149 domain-containing protein [Segetibacter sp.]|jgi:hypothetical protein